MAKIFHAFEGSNVYTPENKQKIEAGIKGASVEIRRLFGTTYYRSDGPFTELVDQATDDVNGAIRCYSEVSLKEALQKLTDCIEKIVFAQAREQELSSSNSNGGPLSYIRRPA